MKSCLRCFMLVLSVAAVVRGSWFQTVSKTPAYTIVSGSFSSSQTCVMVGNNGQRGVLVRSANSGFTWATPTFVTYPVTDVAAILISSTYNFLVVSRSGVIALSTNDGLSFSVTATLGTLNTYFLNGVAIGSNKVAYAVGATQSNTVAKIFKSDSTPPTYSAWNDITPNIASRVLLVFDDMNFLRVCDIFQKSYVFLI